MTRKFKHIESMSAFDKFTCPLLVVDVEATGLNPRRDSIVGVAFASNGKTGYYTTDVAGFFKTLDRSSCALIFHNAVYDLSMIQAYGYKKEHEIHDTMLMASVLDPDRDSLGLKILAKTYLGDFAVEAANAMTTWLSASNRTRDQIAQAPKDLLVKYAAEDALNTWDLYHIFRKKFSEMKRFFSRWEGLPHPGVYYQKHMMSLVPIVVDMQTRGTKLDVAALVNKQAELEARLLVLNKELHEANETGVAFVEEKLYVKRIEERKKRNKSGKLKKDPPRILFNWDSNTHLKHLLFDFYGKVPASKTKKGQPSINSAFLESIREVYPWVPNLLEYKELRKLVSTYLTGLLDRQEGGRIYASFNLAGTATGRFSSSNPNLQNLPKHGNVKELFVPDPGEQFVYADYSQLELRIAAHLSRDPLMVSEYEKDRGGRAQSDLHQRTADALGIERAQAKNINFAIIYAASGWRIAEMMGWMEGIGLCLGGGPNGRCEYKKPCENCRKKRHEAKRGDEIIETLFGQYKGLKAYLEQQKAFMLKHKFAVSPFGKIRRLPNLASEDRTEYNHALKAGYNFPIQSFGASLTKLSMISLHKAGYKIYNQIHDSILIGVPEKDVKKALTQTRFLLENIYPMRVPLIVEPKVLTSFAEK
jgi:DNA polymerase-1